MGGWEWVWDWEGKVEGGKKAAVFVEGRGKCKLYILNLTILV